MSSPYMEPSPWRRDAAQCKRHARWEPKPTPAHTNVEGAICQGGQAASKREKEGSLQKEQRPADTVIWSQGVPFGTLDPQNHNNKYVFL